MVTGAQPPVNCKYGDDVQAVIVSEAELKTRVQQMADKLSDFYKTNYPGEPVVLVGVLKGAVYFITDFSRALDIPSEMEFMVVSSYGSSATSSGMVRILKDLDRDIAGQHVVVVEDIIDSGLTLSWLLKNLAGRGPKTLNVVSLLRKPDAVTRNIDLFDLGFDIPNEFVVGYGLDYAERYRDMPYVGVLRPSVYNG